LSQDKVDQRKYPSSVEVARHAGVSQSAVSRVFSNGGSVSQKTRAKVLAAATELGYQPSVIPRIMLTHRSYLVAIAIGGMYNPFNSRILEQFTRRLQDIGYQVMLVHIEDGDVLGSAMPKLASYRVDAIFVARGVLDQSAAEALAAYRIPIIAFHAPISNEWVSSVSTDSAAAGREMADLFITRGARRCAFINGSRGNTTDRLVAFRQRLVERGGREPMVVTSPFTYEGGREAGAELLAADEAPDAIFCANDLIAIGCIDVARQRGLRVPEDVMIAGFDDIPEAAWSGNSLTTFGHMSETMVETSLEILGEIVENRRSAGVQRVVPVGLIERNSTMRQAR
jgi:DNA-binding LacI/PurR family transcriptional regulator